MSAGSSAAIIRKMAEGKKDIPAKCPKSASPYNHCPFVFRHEDEMVLSYISTLAEEIKRVNGISHANTGDEARIIDQYSCHITAYLNGRIHQIISGT